MGFVNEELSDGSWQTIDRERNIVLKQIRTNHPDYPVEFKLVVNAETIQFKAWQRIKTIPYKGFDILWEVESIYLPQESHLTEEQTKEVIEEALTGYGFAATQKHVLSLSVASNTASIRRD